MGGSQVAVVDSLGGEAFAPVGVLVPQEVPPADQFIMRDRLDVVDAEKSDEMLDVGAPLSDRLRVATRDRRIPFVQVQEAL